MLVGLILGCVGSGILVSHTGHYRWIVVTALAVMSVGILLLTGLTAQTDLPVLWAWMFITGLGIGPTMSVFTVVIQSSVPFSRLGVATGNLTFFRQIGGSVGLAIVGTLFAQSFSSRLAPSLIEAGVPVQQSRTVAQLSSGGGNLTQVGGTSLAEQLSEVPPLQGFVDQIVEGIHGAFSLAIADTFWLGLVTTLVALTVVAVGLRELPLRRGAPAAAQASDVPDALEGQAAEMPMS